MKGSLKKRGQYWYVIVDIKDENGDRKQKWINTHCEKKQEAERELRKVLSQIDNNTFVIPKKILYHEFVREWLENTIKPQVEYTTWLSYKAMVLKHIVPYFRQKDIRLQDLQPIHLQKYYEHKHTSNGLSGNTLRKHQACIRGSLKYAVRMNLIPYNPDERVILPKKDKFTGKFYTVEQLETLLTCVANTPIESAVFIAAYYGLRRGEVLGLKWNAIDFKEGTISIRETRVKYGKEIVVKKPKNETSQRTLPLIKEVEEYLKELKKKQKQNKKQLGDEYKDEGYVCCLSDGTALPPDYLNHKFKDVIKVNNLPPLRFHDLRHTTASLLLKMGVSMKEIQIWLGHGDITTTLNIYSHVDLEMKKNVAKKLNGIFKD